MSQPVKPDPGSSAPTHQDLVALARRRFLAGERIRVDELAVELGISRATAFRWAGNAEQLAGDVIANLVDATHARTLREARGTGVDRILDTLARGLHYIATSKAYQAFLARDPQKALRIVASKEGPVQARTIAHHEALLREELEAGRIALPVDPHTMAYALVRIAESFLYADLIAGEAPDLDKAVEILALMLRGTAR